jgi:hypothetical protein
MVRTEGEEQTHAVPTDTEDVAETQGPHGLTGEAAAAEEASAQQRLLSVPSAPEPPTGWRGRLRQVFEMLAPTAASILMPAAPDSPPGFQPQFAVVASHSDEECSICLATLGPCVITPCRHSFHAACLEHYFNTSREPNQRARCPLCRSSVHAPMPIEVRAVSGLPLEAVAVPAAGSRCHFDRPYRFLHLGDFARPHMLFLLSSNEDRKTSVRQPMWIIDASVPCTVHVNYRSTRHVIEGQQESWLAEKGFTPNGGLSSACTSGVPNGPYTGPVYSAAFEPGRIELMGSNTWEGTYFVFVEIRHAAQPVATEGVEGGGEE